MLVNCQVRICLPECDGKYDFEQFNKTLTDIDSFLKPNGLLCIYNSKYIFTDSDISTNYICIETNHKETGFVYKYNKNENRINNYPYYLFKKST